MIAVVTYEYVITSGAEVRLFWQHKFTIATALFLLNRYCTLFNTLYEIVYGFIPFTSVQVGPHFIEQVIILTILS